MRDGMRERANGKPMLLDLYSGAGGAARGYQRAGFYVVGVDIKPQPRYAGDEFIQADAMTYPLEGFDAIHASPPCQAHTSLKSMWNRKEHIDLLTPTLERLSTPWRYQHNGRSPHWIVENVGGSPMRAAIQLCGTSFHLGTADAELRRHRLFETSLPIMAPTCAHGRKSRVIGVYGGHGRDRRRTVNTQDYSTDERREAMGIDWMTGAELSQAIPPAFTEYLGRHLILELDR